MSTEPDLDGLTESERRLYPIGTINNDGGAAAVARHFAISLVAERRKSASLASALREIRSRLGISIGTHRIHVIIDEALATNEKGSE